MKSAQEKIILGSWDGQPIWRYKTSGERLAEEIEKGKQLAAKKRESNGKEI